MQYNNTNKWLDNFDEIEKETAFKLYNSLQFFGLSNIEEEIHSLLNFTNKKVNYAIYPVMDIKNVKHQNSSEHYLDYIKERKLFFETISGNKVNDADSEYVFMHLIRNYCNNKSFLHSMPLREEYKLKKIREIILITDIIASGQQVKDFLEYLIKDKTIKSYISLNLISKIHVICHMATNRGINKIGKIKVFSKENIIDIRCSRIARTISNYFSPIERERIVRLCKKYSKKNPMGYGNIGLLSIYKHKSSNNIPPILNQYKRKWSGIIEDRRAKNEFVENIADETYYNLESILMIINKSNKSIATRLSSLLGINICHAEAIITKLFKANYISKKGYFTLEGKKLYKKMCISEKQENIKEIDSYVERIYYPYYKKRHST